MGKGFAAGGAEKRTIIIMKKFKSFFMTMLAVAVCCGFTACGDDDDDDEPGNDEPGWTPGSTDMTGIPTAGTTPDALLGEWEFSEIDEDGDPVTMTFRFKHNGVCSVNMDDSSSTLASCNASGNNLRIDMGYMVFDGSYSISGDKLTYNVKMSYIDEPGSFTTKITLYKVSDNTGYEPAKVSGAILGAWYNSFEENLNGEYYYIGHRITFLSNGLAQYLQTEKQGNGDEELIPFYFAYSADNGVISTYDANGNETNMFLNGAYSISGNELTFASSGYTFTRK